MLSKRLIDSVKRHEGFRSRPYKDTEDILTIGYGTNLEALDITKEEAEVWMRKDLNKIIEILCDDPLFMQIDKRARREVIIEMAYNLGISGLYKFKKMWAAIDNSSWELAAKEMLDSKWARQVGNRAVRLAERMRTGEWE